MPRPTALPLDPKVSGLSSSIAWLRDRGIPAKRIAEIFGITEAHTRQLAFRGQWRVPSTGAPGNLEAALKPPADPFAPVTDDLRLALKIRSRNESWMVRPGRAARVRTADLEASVEQLGEAFWSGVRHGVGLDRFRGVLIAVGRPAHFSRIRILARIRQLLAETYAHAGYSSSAIQHGLTSLLLSKAAHDESGDPHDLGQFAKTALIVSQGHLLRYESRRSSHYLDLHRDAHARIDHPLGGEYFRQRGAIAFQSGKDADEEARWNFAKAMVVLSETVEYGRLKERYEVLNIGTRQMNLLGRANWDGAQELLDYMVTTLPPGEIQISMNVNWAAACGFSTDSPAAHIAVSELLFRYSDASIGYGHQATVAWLLSLTPALPEALRADWVRRALYENTFKDY